MTDAIKLKSLPEAHCKDCSLAAMCLPLALQDQELDTLDSIVKRGRPLRKGEMLFRQGDPFDSLYALRSGTIKTFTVDDAGVEQITGFHLASELIGLSGTQLPRASSRPNCDSLMPSSFDGAAMQPSIRQS